MSYMATCNLILTFLGLHQLSIVSEGVTLE